ncbi:hypothetical protein ACTXT7_000205 [Hymenolepis weldensis]
MAQRDHVMSSAGPNDKTEVELRRLVRPSDMLRRARALMEVLIDLEDLVRIDVVAVFTSVFEQHAQPSSDASKIGLVFPCLKSYSL